MSNDHTHAPPATYAEWSVCLDRFEAGLEDAAVVAAMGAGTLGWAPGVAERFSARIAGVYDKRLARCADRMTRELRTGSDEVTLVRALVDTRRTLALLHGVASLAVFPALLREHLASSVQTYATRSQQALEDSARQDRSGRLGSIVRNNSLLRYAAPAGADNASGPSMPQYQVPAPSPGARRRNIIV